MTQRTYERCCLSEARIDVLRRHATNALKLDGEFWECGVFRGGSARILADILRPRPHTHPLRLFDTFAGFRYIAPEDQSFPKLGMFSATDFNDVYGYVNADFAVFHQGAVPDTFSGLDKSRIAFAHLDLDLYRPTLAALEFVLPRMVSDGVIVVDDYGDSQWPGVALAVAECVPTSYVTAHEFGIHDHQAVINKWV